jgi:hypothetical protein
MPNEAPNTLRQELAGGLVGCGLLWLAALALAAALLAAGARSL